MKSFIVIGVNTTAFFFHKGLRHHDCFVSRELKNPLEFSQSDDDFEVFPILCALVSYVQPMVYEHDVWGWDKAGINTNREYYCEHFQT